MTGSSSRRKLAAILSADVVGYSRRAAFLRLGWVVVRTFSKASKLAR